MKIYFLHNGLISFVRKDLLILESAHEVRAELNYRRMLRNLWRNLKGVLWCDLLFCWFASIHFLPSVLLARLLGRKVIVVAGGYEVANMPEINYGNMRGGVKTFLVRLLLRMADRVISISESNRREALENGRIDPARSVMIYHGFTAEYAPIVQKERFVITAGEVNWVNLKRKGLEDFVQLGGFFPDAQFKLIGKWSDDSHHYLRKIASSNVEILGFVDDKTLDDLFRRAKVYLQPSRHEGFGSSVAEAMLYRCIPVVSNSFSLPEVVGDCGILVQPGDLEGFRNALARALTADAAPGEAARERIVKTFPLERRAKELLKVVGDV
jgi:glycosyltransferase involved in cell wall biosynthesis